MEMQWRLKQCERNSYSFSELPRSFSKQKTRGHSKRFIQPPARTQVYANSFFNIIIKNWNELSETVVSASTVDTFKSRLSKHLNSV